MTTYTHLELLLWHLFALSTFSYLLLTFSLKNFTSHIKIYTGKLFLINFTWEIYIYKFIDENYFQTAMYMESLFIYSVADELSYAAHLLCTRFYALILSASTCRWKIAIKWWPKIVSCLYVLSSYTECMRWLMLFHCVDPESGCIEENVFCWRCLLGGYLCAYTALICFERHPKCEIFSGTAGNALSLPIYMSVASSLNPNNK